MSVNWSTYWETQPTGSDSPTLGDNKFRELIEAVRERLDQGHVMSYATSGAITNDGWHKEGSARAFVASTAPGTLNDPSTTNMSTAVGGKALYEGRMYFDADNAYVPHVGYGTDGFVGFERNISRISIQGTLATGTDLMPPIAFPRACKIKRCVARVLTAPTTDAIICDIKRYNSSGTTQGSVFGSDGYRLTIAATELWDDKDDGNSELDATNQVLAYGDYLNLDIAQVGGTTKGADMAIIIEAVLDTT